MNPKHLLVPALLCLGTALSARDLRPQAMALVKEAVAFGKQRGRAFLIRETNMNSGHFHAKPGEELYIFIFDKNGFALAHGAQANMVNINRMDAKDPDGKYFVREFIQGVAGKDSCWVDYKYTNPKTGKLEAKTSYLETWDGLIIGCGTYK